MNQNKIFSQLAGVVTIVSSLTASVPVAFAAESAPQAPKPSVRGSDTLKIEASDSDEAGTLPERIDVQSMKKRYWTVGNEDLMDVVQNRQYTKKGRVETAVRYGFYSDDPFQSMSSLGFTLGYHFNEFFSLHGNYASVSASPSSAFKQAQANQPTGFTPIVNPSESLMALEGRGSLMYGKLSLLGNAIFYYDFNFALGAGKLSNKLGDGPTVIYGGFGQEFYMNRTFFITVDYRVLKHTDKFPATGNTAGTRSVTTNWIQLGVGAFIF
jgi:outer membrane beta-barrel protein